MEDSDVFSIGPANAANRAEFADAVGGAQSCYAMGTSVAIGSVGCVEFIATSNPSKVSVRGDGIVDRKREVPGNTKDVLYTNVMQARENVLYYRRFHAFLRLLAIGSRHAISTTSYSYTHLGGWTRTRS
jgi:hypothetical protein